MCERESVWASWRIANWLLLSIMQAAVAASAAAAAAVAEEAAANKKMKKREESDQRRDQKERKVSVCVRERSINLSVCLSVFRSVCLRVSFTTCLYFCLCIFISSCVWMCVLRKVSLLPSKDRKGASMESFSRFTTRGSVGIMFSILSYLCIGAIAWYRLEAS